MTRDIPTTRPAPADPDRLVVVQDVPRPTIPTDSDVMTIVVSLAPGDPGLAPHRHTGPTFGYVLEGEMAFEIEGSAPRIVKAGEAFWEPGGDVIHYRGANNRDDAWLRFVATTMVASDERSAPTVFVAEDELATRAHLRVT